ncbi:MAG TPA: glycoside hydrolase family 172 protein [Fodinibius sp.]|nr:glycoside hydrolase family 172 protein [Fodinibius sp.]
MSDNLSRSDFFKIAGTGLGTAMLPFTPFGKAAGPQYTISPYGIPEGVKSRWTSPENREGRKGAGAKENRGAKGHAFDEIKAGESYPLLDVKGAGIVNRIKMTIKNRSPKMLRSLRIDMYWDGRTKPAVSAPLGDFFGVGLGRTASFECDFFSNPEGRSFNCFIPMPFREAARIVITNDSDQDVTHIFYNVNYQLINEQPENALYFHSFWNRNTRTTLGKDYEVLPRLEGTGQFLGTNIGVIANPDYGNLWWGEGEVKMYLDGDDRWPTLVSTGTEDYIGTAWGQDVYADRYQGSTIADEENRQWTFYRYHIPDPVYFHKDLKVAVQQIGGGFKKKVKALAEEGAEMKYISVDQQGKFFKLLEDSNQKSIDELPDGWVNFYRRDDWSSTAYFYLTEPVSNLPELPDIDVRTAKIINNVN